MKYFVAYNSGGKILAHGSVGGDALPPSVGSDWNILEVFTDAAYEETHYVTGGALSALTNMTGLSFDKTTCTANAADVVTVSGVSSYSGLKVEIRGPDTVAPTTVTGSSLELTFSRKGTFQVIFTAPGRLTKTVTVDAN